MAHAHGLAVRGLRMNEDGVAPQFQATSRTDQDRGKGQIAHSGLGIASFVIAVSCLVLLVVVVILALVSGSDDPDAILSSPSVGATIVVGMVILNLAPLTGIGLGIAGLFAREYRRTYAALGLALNSLMVAILILVWWVGRG